MHMEAITFLFSSSTDSSSAGHDYNPELVEQKTLLLCLPSRLHVSEMLQSPEIQAKNRAT